MFDGKNLLHDESLLKQNKTRQKARLRKRFEDNMSADIKLSKTQNLK